MAWAREWNDRARVGVGGVSPLPLCRDFWKIRSQMVASPAIWTRISLLFKLENSGLNVGIKLQTIMYACTYPVWHLDVSLIQRGSYLTRGENESSSVKHGQFPWFFKKLSSYLFDNLFILIPFHCIITKEHIKINVTRSLLSNSILSKDAVAWRHGNLMNENYQVGGLDLLWILLRNCDWFMVEGVWCKHQWKKFYYIIMSLRICSTMLLSDNMIWLDFQAAALRWIITWLRPQKEWICNCTIGSGPIPPPYFFNADLHESQEQPDWEAERRKSVTGRKTFTPE